MSRRLALLRLLEGYSPSANEERDHARMLVLAQESGDVLSRYHFDPGHFTASGFVVSEDTSHVLLVLHERVGRWLQPGGHIEPGDESIEAAVRREIAEETGLTELERVGEGLFDIDVHEIPAGRGEPHHEHHDLRYLFRADGDPVPGGGVIGVRWTTWRDLEKSDTDGSVRHAASKLTG